MGYEYSLQVAGDSLVWLIVAMLCLLAAHRVQLFAGTGNGWSHNVPQYH